MTKLTVIYEPNSNSKDVTMVPDGDAMDYVKDLIHAANMRPLIQVTGQALVVDCVRLCVARGMIPAGEVIFQFNGENIFVSKLGNLDRWPRGFCDYTDNILEELLTSIFEEK